MGDRSAVQSGERVTRRSLLVASTVAASALAGCGGLTGDGGSGGDQPRLQTLRLANDDTEPHTVHVLVLDGETPVHWSTHELGPGGDGDGQDGGQGGDGQDGSQQDDAPSDRTTVERTWPDEPGEYAVHARLDDWTDWHTVDLTERSGDGGNCWGLELEVTSDGQFEVWSNEDPEGCPSGGEDEE